MKKKLSRWTAVFTVMLLCMGLCSGLPVSAAYENTHRKTAEIHESILWRLQSRRSVIWRAAWKGQLRGITTTRNTTCGTVGSAATARTAMDIPGVTPLCPGAPIQAGIGTDVIPRTAGTGTGRSFFVRQGTYQQSAANGGSYVPQAGDIIYYGSGSSPSHVGIVSGCNGSTVYAIEGNCSDMVTTRAIGLSDGYIIGYGVPNYKSVHPAPSLGVTPGNSSTETVFSWNALDGVTRYDLKVWKTRSGTAMRTG